MRTEIRVSTLGTFTIQRDGKLLDNFITTKAMLLFTYLAMNPGEHPRKKIAFMFWSETPDKQALKNLRTVLSSLRQQVGDCLSIGTETIAIRSEDVSVTVDATLFEQGYARLQASPGNTDVLGSMTELVALYQGDFLATVTIREANNLDNWVSEKQRHLSQLYLRLLYDLVTIAEKQKRYDTALHYAWTLIRVDPLWDEAQRQLMRLLASTQRANEALLQYEQFIQRLEEELGATPEPETTALYEQIRRREFRPPAPNKRASIVLPDMPFVEPVEPIELAQRMLNTPHCRLLTVFGISGIGKTSLVTRLAFQRQQLFRDGAYLVSVQRTHTPRDLPYIIADALGVDLGSQTDEASVQATLLDYLRVHEVMLVLDNYEHLLPSTDFVEHMVEEVPHLQVIITSQMPLNLFREWLMPLSGLRVPASDDLHPETFEAVRLFDLTAQRINPHFNLDKDIEGVVKICQLVDGLPLAIAIAAGWTQILPVSKIIEHITQGNSFEMPLQQRLPVRHQSLESMLDYTWRTLSLSEEYALTGLSIFEGAFDIEKAQHICAVDAHVLAPLIQKSLIQKFEDRYRMHQLIRLYARRKLDGHILQELLELRYTDYFTQRLSSLQGQHLLLHEYIIALESDYSSIWNFDWMRPAYQPEYILIISRYLIPCWEVSRTDAIPGVLHLLESLPSDNLPPQSQAFLNLQIARLAILQKDYPKATHHLQDTLREHPDHILWEDLCLAFSFNALLFDLVAKPDLEGSYKTNEDPIFRAAQLKLAILHLDIQDFESVESILLHLLDNPHSPVTNACIWAAWGALAAKQQRYAVALQRFTTALQILEPLFEPLLKQSINMLLKRNAHELYVQGKGGALN